MIEKLDWDSTFFGFNIGEVNLDAAHCVNEDLSYDLLVIKSPNDFDIVLQNFTITLSEQKNIYSRKLERVETLNIDSNIKPEGELKNPNLPQLYAIAFESGKWSRFKRDNRFPANKFQELYKKWIDNSINKTFADAFLVFEQDGQILGIVTVKLHDNFGQIGLIGVLPGFQGKGIGRKLLVAAENFCKSNDITELHIPTQNENIQACAFYKKVGYDLLSTSFIKHAWKN